MQRTFEDLVAEAEAAPISGWNFDWLKGRATEERPAWRYSHLLGERYARARRVLDLQSGGGEVLAGLPRLPPLLVATEGHPPNVPVAAGSLRPRGASVVPTDDVRKDLPFISGAFDLVTSRHPVSTWWEEIARVLDKGGSYLSQQVGPDSMRTLSEFIMGPWPKGSDRDPVLARSACESVGLVVADLRRQRLRTVFYDVGAVVFFLRLVVWIVPDFTVDRYRDRLEALHDEIVHEGSYAAYASRFLIEAVKPS